MTNLPESTQPGKNTTPYPGAVLPLWRSKNFDPHVLDRQSLYFMQQPVSESLGER